MNFLELVQMVTRESGTVQGTQPTSVVGQTGRLAKCIYWTQQAWVQIQNSRNAWKWMRADCTVDTIADLEAYTATSFGIGSTWAEWLVDVEGQRVSDWSVYLVSDGVAYERELVYLDWLDFRRQYRRGPQTSNPPVHFSINDDGAIVLGPTPDGVYRVTGRYRKTVQRLTANTDEPNMPARFHELVAWKALLLLAKHDEAPMAATHAAGEARRITFDLERDQLPQVRVTMQAIA